MSEKLELTQLQESVTGKCDVYLFDSIASTNTWAMQEVRNDGSLPFACFAEQQTQGRGRRGKAWISPPGGNIYMSLAWKFDLPVNQLGLLSLATGVAIVKTLEQLGIEQVKLKWPNDVLVNQKKIAGVLIEVAKAGEQTTSVVIGIGLNYRLPVDGDTMPDQPWTDVVSSLGAVSENGRTLLAGALLQQSVIACEQFAQNQATLLSEFRNSYDAYAGKAVNVVLDTGEQLRGTVCGITSQGEIRILINDEERVFNSADISLRQHQTGGTV